MGPMCLPFIEQLSSLSPMYANVYAQALLAICILLAAVFVTQIRMSSPCVCVCVCVCVLTRAGPLKGFLVPQLTLMY